MYVSVLVKFVVLLVLVICFDSPLDRQVSSYSMIVCNILIFTLVYITVYFSLCVLDVVKILYLLCCCVVTWLLVVVVCFT